MLVFKTLQTNSAHLKLLGTKSAQLVNFRDQYYIFA